MIDRQQHYCLDRDTPWQPGRQDGVVEHEVQRQPRKPVICCAQCLHSVTEQAAGIEVAGAHRHVFTNPGGFVYELALYRQANCRESGIATTQYTWFAGYAWQLALCAKCHAHLGWYYHKPASPAFYGLICARLREVNI